MSYFRRLKELRLLIARLSRGHDDVWVATSLVVVLIGDSWQPFLCFVRRRIFYTMVRYRNLRPKMSNATIRNETHNEILSSIGVSLVKENGVPLLNFLLSSARVAFMYRAACKMKSLLANNDHFPLRVVSPRVSPLSTYFHGESVRNVITSVLLLQNS